MPVIEVDYKDLISLLGVNISKDNLSEYLMQIKAEIDEDLGSTLKIEVKDTNRPDLWSIEGITRELKGILEIEEGLPSYSIYNNNYLIIVDKTVTNIRPYIAAAVVKDVKMNNNVLSSLIQLQDKVMQTFGRNRKKVAIGTHNLNLIEFPIKYTTAPPDFKFVPLNEDREMTLKEILEDTPTGKKYGYILQGYREYPILLDAKGEVISFPPIINSNKIGRLTENSKDIFIDVTGTDLQSVLLALNVIVTALADRGGKIYSVIIKYPDREFKTPQLRTIKRSFNLQKIKKLLGLELSNTEIISLLKKKRFNAAIDNDILILEWLNYRNDILSEQDIVEELAIAYDFNKIEPKVPSFYTKGSLTKKRKVLNKVRDIMVRLGVNEIYTPTLTSLEVSKLTVDENSIIKIINPVSRNYDCLRPSLLVPFLIVLRESKGISLPSQFFEIGYIVRFINQNKYEALSLFYAYVDDEVNVNIPKSILDRLFKELNVNYKIENSKLKFGITGRSGKIIIENEEIGWIAEISPELLEKLEIDVPVSAFEIDLSKLIQGL